MIKSLEKKALREQIGEAIHTSFRKASDHHKAYRIWKLIDELPDEEWGAVLDFIVDGLYN